MAKFFARNFAICVAKFISAICTQAHGYPICGAAAHNFASLGLRNQFAATVLAHVCLLENEFLAVGAAHA